MKKLNKKRNSPKQIKIIAREGIQSFTLSSYIQNQLGVAPLVFLAISGIFLAFVLLLIGSQSLNVKSPLATPVPSGNMIGNAIIASPIPVDPNDPALCDDQYNADCDNSEGDDVDPADLAGPD